MMEHLNIVQVCITNYTQYIDNSILHPFTYFQKNVKRFQIFLYHKELNN